MAANISFHEPAPAQNTPSTLSFCSHLRVYLYTHTSHANGDIKPDAGVAVFVVENGNVSDTVGE